MAALRRGAYRGDERHPALGYQGCAIDAIHDAIAAILKVAGFDVKNGADEYHHPMELLVESRRVRVTRSPAVVPDSAGWRASQGRPDGRPDLPREGGPRPR
jgi:hypothetical protein